MRKQAVLVLMGLAATIATSARAEVGLTDKNAAQKEIRRAKLHAPQAPGARSLIDNSGLEWFLNTDITFATTSSASGAASEASFAAAVAASTSAGGTASAALGDAFDGYNALVIDDGTGPVVFNQNGPASATCLGTITGSNRELIYDAQLIGSVSVRRRVFVPENDAFARWLDVLTNVGGSTVNVTVSTVANLGSDNGTIVVNSSDGDALAEVTDNWVTSFENWTGGVSGDPRLAHVIQGAGAPVQVGAIAFGSQGLPEWGYNVSLAAGQTRTIANFASGHGTKAAAATQAAALAALPTNALKCMSPVEVAEIANFVVPSATNLIVNGSFELGGATLFPFGWISNDLTTGDGLVCEPDGTASGGTNAFDGVCSVRMNGVNFSAVRTEEGFLYLRQNILLSGGSGDNFTFSARAKSAGAATGGTRKFQVVAKFLGGGDGIDTKILKFKRGTHDWEAQTKTFNTTSTYTKIRVEVQYFGQTGVAHFDGLSLVMN